jgi:hypothetical protein
MKQLKLGHQAPPKYRINQFNSIRLEGDFAYCKSHEFVFNPTVERQKLYDGKACIYTDDRFVLGGQNWHGACYFSTLRRHNVSLKACVRKTLKVRNIPVGTVLRFTKKWYLPKTEVDNSFLFKIKKENPFPIEYQINNPVYSQQFTCCSKSASFTDILRENGFLVGVCTLPNETEYAIAYGHGKIIGFTEFNKPLFGYGQFEHNILWDKLNHFDKWSTSERIHKSTPLDEIINILKSIP